MSKRVLTPRVTRLPRLAIDFDGVIHAYSKGWLGGAIYDDPMPGCREALLELSKRNELVVFTARHDLEAVRVWLLEHRLLHFFRDITNRKPMADIYLDDRALRFQSWEQALEDIHGTQES